MNAAGGRRSGRWAGPPSRLVAPMVFVALVAWEGLQGRYSSASHVSVLAVIGVLLVLALWAGRARQRKPSRVWLRDVGRAARRMPGRGRASATSVGALVWTLLVATTVAWDALSFAVQRQWLPTLSRIFGAITDHHAGRALVFAAWLVLGFYLALGWRKSDEPQVAEPQVAVPRCPERQKEDLG